MIHPTSRREFLKTTTLAAAGLCLPPTRRPAEKLRIGVVGVGGRGGANLNGVRGEHVAALCDVDENVLGAAAAGFPEAALYADFRRMLELSLIHI